MVTPRTASLLLALVAGGVAAAEPLEFDSGVGLPTLAQTNGQTLAWRSVVWRANASAFGLELKLPTCLTTPRTVASTATSATAPADCAASLAGLAPAPASRELNLQFHLPRAFEAGPDLDIALRAWHTPGHSASATRAERGLATEIELNQDIGPASVYAGYSVPVRRSDVQSVWCTAFGGIHWNPAPRHELEIGFEFARERFTGEHDRQFSLRYDFARDADLRWQFFATRRVDDPALAWESGLGIDWRF